MEYRGYEVKDEVCAFVAAGAAIALTTVRDGYNAHSSEWF
jgi:hypothetical protein